MLKKKSILIFTGMLITSVTLASYINLGYYPYNQDFENNLSVLASQSTDNTKKTSSKYVVKNIKLYYQETDKDDWSLAIQRALDSAKDEKNITVYIPKGTYKIKKECIVYGNTTINMDSEATLVLDGASRFFINGGDDKKYRSYTGNSNITISGGILDVNKKTKAAISFAHGRNITIENVTIKNVVDSHGIELSALKNVLIKNCKFLNFKNVDTTNKYYLEAIQLDVNTEKAFPSFGGYDGTPNDAITIENCYFGKEDIPPAGFGAWPAGIGSHSSIRNKWNKNITIRNCIFDGMTYAGISNLKWNNTTIENNTFKNNAVSIIANVKSNDTQSFQKLTIKGNTLINSGTTNSAILIEGAQIGKKITRVKYIDINNNTIINPPEKFQTIKLSFVQSAVINNNNTPNPNMLLQSTESKSVKVKDNNP